MSTVRLVDAVSLAKRVENIDITVAGDEAKWNDAKSAVLREIADSPTHDLSALIKAAQAEAVKEFAERLKNEFHEYRKQYKEVANFDGAAAMLIAKRGVDILVKEVVGED